MRARRIGEATNPGPAPHGPAGGDELAAAAASAPRPAGPSRPKRHGRCQAMPCRCGLGQLHGLQAR
eukprot:5885854-Lingulodinium_polyedra.AAC.1